jgi:hypothetical protein
VDLLVTDLEPRPLVAESRPGNLAEPESLTVKTSGRLKIVDQKRHMEHTQRLHGAHGLTPPGHPPGRADLRCAPWAFLTDNGR